MFIGRKLCAIFLGVLFSVHSQELCEVVATDFIAGIAAMHPPKDPWRVLTVLHGARTLAIRSPYVSTVVS
jgi:predicted RNA-binding protein with PUA domain